MPVPTSDRRRAHTMVMLVLAAAVCGCPMLAPVVVPASEQPVASPASLSDLERRVLAAANAERQRHGLGHVHAQEQLHRAARMHSSDMADRGYFAHVSPDGHGAAERVGRTGYTYRLVAENLYRTARYRRFTYTDRSDPSTYRYEWYTPQELADRVVRGWMESPGHRRNMLTPEYLHAGVGVSAAGDDLYFTLVLATPR